MPDRTTNRREFLTGHSSLNALQDAAQSLVATADDDVGAIEPAEPERAGYLLRFTRRAMACEFEVLLPPDRHSKSMEAAMAALDIVDELESQLTVFRDTSEVSQLNRMAHLRPIDVESRLFDLLRQAAEIHQETAGAYDITSGPLSKVWGFYRRAGRMPDEQEIAEALERVGMRHLEFDADHRRVKFAVPGIEINLGSIGKGYALDRAAEVLEAAGVIDFLLHGGNSSVLARGSANDVDADDSALQNPLPLGEGKPSENPLPLGDGVSKQAAGGWWVGLRHPLQPRKRVGEIRLGDRAIGTSGSGTQFFVHDGRRYGHILDPRSGWPAVGTLSTTVVAPTGAQADALATAFYVMGRDAATEYCRRHSEISAVIMSPISGSSRVELMLLNFVDGDIRLLEDELLAVSQCDIRPNLA